MTQQLPILSFVGMADYKPWDGGGHGFVPQEGYYKVRIESCDPEVSKDPTKGMVKVGCTILDTDVGTGTPLISRVLYSGMDKDGKPLVRQFCDFLVSCGTPVDNINSYGAQGVTGDIRQSVAQLVGREAFIEVRFEPYNGQLQSNIANWVSREVYEKQCKGGGHRKRKAENVSVEELVRAKGGQAGAGAVAPVHLGGHQPGMMPGGAGVPGMMQPQQPGMPQPQIPGQPANFGGAPAGVAGAPTVPTGEVPNL